MGHDEFRLHHAVDDAKLSPHGAVFLCGAYQFAGDIGTGLVDALPPVFAFRADVADPLHSVLTLLSHEMAHAQPGQQTVLDRLLDVLVVLGLRTGLARSLDAPAWFRALNDERLSRALQAIHESPERPWTVAELADVSRSCPRESLARNFQKTLGKAIAYAVPLGVADDPRPRPPPRRRTLIGSSCRPRWLLVAVAFTTAFDVTTARPRDDGAVSTYSFLPRCPPVLATPNYE